MGQDERLAAQEPAKPSPRADLLFKMLIPITAILLFAGVLLSLDNWFLRPVRELARMPGVRLWGHSATQRPWMRHQVTAVSFRGQAITPEVLRTIRDFPNLHEITFSTCTIPPEAAALLPEFPELYSVRLSYSKIPPDTGAWLAKLPDLIYLTVEDCQMDVAHFISECAGTRIEQLRLWRIPLAAQDLRELNRWNRLDYLSLRETQIHRENVRDIAKSKSLGRVAFSDMGLGDEVIAEIAEADAIATLILENTDLTEAHIALLSRCRGLQNLNINLTNVPVSAIRFLEQSPSLERVYAGFTPLGEGINERVLSNGCVIYGSDWVR